MKFEILKANISQLIKERNTSLIVSLLMGVSNIALLSAYLFKNERVILVPPHIKNTFWVEEGRISMEYLEQMSLFMSTLLLDISPSSCAYKRDIILRYATPESYSELKKKLIDDEERYRELQLSTTFKPQEVISDPKTLEVVLKGQLSSFVAGQKIRESQETLTLQFNLRGGKIMLQTFKGGKSSMGDSHAP